MRLTREEVIDAEVIAELAGKISPEDVQRIIDAQFDRYAQNEPSIIEKLGRDMCGG